MKKNKLIKILMLLIFASLSIVTLYACGWAKDKMGIVSDITYDGTKISWVGITDATEYEVSIGDDVYKTTTTTYEYNSNKKDFTVTIAVAGIDGKENSDKVSRSFKFIKDVSNIIVVDGVMHWDAVDGVSGYKVALNGIEQTDVLTANNFADIEPSKSVKVEVRGVKDNAAEVGYFSAYGESLTVNLLTAPVLMFDKNSKTITWNKIDRAEGYALKFSLGGEVLNNKTLSADSVSFNDTFTKSGEYTIEVRSNGNSTNGLDDSKYASIRITRLGSPSGITNIVTDVNNETTITFSPVEKATGYDVKIGANTYSPSGNSINYKFAAVISETIYNVKITAKTTDNYVLDAIETADFALTKLGPVKNIQNQDGFLTWDTVRKATSYKIKVSGVDKMVTGNRFEMPELEAGRHTVAVCALGNGSEIIASDFKSYNVTRLDKPKGLSIASGVLSWTSVSGAQVYEVHVGSEVINSERASYEIDPTKLTNSTAVYVVAKGNNSDILTSIASETKLLSRLNAPTINVSNDAITWNTVDGAQSYSVYINTNSPKTVLGTSLPTADLNAVTNTITVCAQGNLITTFLSDKSAPITTTKLASVVLSADATNAKFAWTNAPFATGYELMIDTKIMTVDNTVREYKPQFTQAETHNFKVRAIGNGQTYVSGSWAEISQQTTLLAKPEGSDFNIVKSTGLITITITGTIANASGYTVIVDGKDYAANAQKKVEYPHSGAKTINIAVRADGDGFSYVNSQASLAKKITILSKVAANSVQWDNTDGFCTITWDGVTDALGGYSVTVTKYDLQNIETVVTPNPGAAASIDVITEGFVRMRVSIVANGDGITFFDSEPTEVTILLIQ